MVKIILMRHGYSITNRDKRFTGQMDVPLDEAGVIQGKQACEYIYKNYKVDRVYSSDLSRAVNTVKPLADMLNLEIETDSAFRELSMGKWEGMYIADVKNTPEYELYRQNPVVNPCDGGENYTQLVQRAYGALEKIVAENEGKTVVIASHGGLMRVLSCYLKFGSLARLKELAPLANACTSVINYENGKYSFELEGYCDYLDLKTAVNTNH